MTLTIGPTSFYNVQASINAYVRAQLALVTLPAHLGTLPAIVTNWQEITATLPCFSLAHLDVGGEPKWEGDAVGGSAVGIPANAILEIDCWVSRSSTNWLAILRSMADMVYRVAGLQSPVKVKNYASDATGGTETGYLARFGAIRTVATAPDPNPDIERVRILVSYSYTVRSA